MITPRKIHFRTLLAAGSVVAVSMLSACAVSSDSLDTFASFIAEAKQGQTDAAESVEQPHGETMPVMQNEFVQLTASPMPAGTAIDISSDYPVPGEYFDFNHCTAAYSFTLVGGRSFAVTASHCGKEGDIVWAGNQDGSFTFPADPVGTVVYSDLFAPGTRNLDVALIELNGLGIFDTPQTVDNTVATQLNELPPEVCKLGRMTGITCGQVTHQPALGRLNTGEHEVDSESARAQVCARTGDSGGPVFAEIDGRSVIVGLVSGTSRLLEKGQSCDGVTDIDLSFTSAIEIQRLAEEILGPIDKYSV